MDYYIAKRNGEYLLLGKTVADVPFEQSYGDLRDIKALIEQSRNDGWPNTFDYGAKRVGCEELSDLERRMLMSEEQVREVKVFDEAQARGQRLWHPK